jgi:hypothetical protein
VTYRLFNYEYQIHKVLAFTISEVRHFSGMAIPEHSTKARKIRLVHQDDATVIAAPHQFTLLGLDIVFTEYAMCHGKNVNENGI